VITPPGGAPQTGSLTPDPLLSADPSVPGAHHWSMHPLAPKADLGRAPAAKPFAPWSIKVKNAGAADFRSLPPQSLRDLVLILQFEVS
jgi:hypothetical protein